MIYRIILALGMVALLGGCATAQKAGLALCDRAEIIRVGLNTTIQNAELVGDPQVKAAIIAAAAAGLAALDKCPSSGTIESTPPPPVLPETGV